MNCLTEAVLQRRFDGELTAVESEAVGVHLSACAGCAAAAHRLADEMALLRSLFADAEEAVSVPTQRLQARVRAAVADETASSTLCAPQPSSSWRRLAALFTARPQPGWGLAFAALAAVGVMLLTLGVWRPHMPNSENVDVAVSAGPANPAPAPDDPGDVRAPVSFNPKSNRVSGASVKRQPRPRIVAAAAKGAKSEAAGVKLLPGEKSYLKAIVSLESNFQARGDSVLRPEARVEYERNLAVVDQAIVTTRAAAMRDPFDTDANQMLLSAYQSKVELMSAAMTTSENSFGER